MKFNAGSSGFTITSEEITSDYTTFSLDETKTYVVAFHVSATTGSGVPYSYNEGGDLGTWWFYQTAQDQSSWTDVSSYTDAADYAFGFSEIEVQ